MEYIYLGRLTNTHGIKGEVKIKSNFKYKEKVFKKGFYIYIGPNKEKHEIVSYRPHKEYDMVILKDLYDINLVLQYKNSLVFINKEDLSLNNNEYLNEDLIGCDCFYNKELVGTVKDITDQGNNNEVIEINNKDKKIYIPKNEHFIENLDIKNKEIKLKNVEGLI